MSQVVNTNLSAAQAQRLFGRAQGDTLTSLARLSSGMRITRAADDAAGLAISDRMFAQLRGLNAGARNATDAISLTQTAEGALSTIGESLQRIRELAVQAATSSLGTADRAALNAEARALIDEVERVGTQTEFNGIRLLDGSFGGQSVQVGAESSHTVAIGAIADARSSALGSYYVAASGTKVKSVTAGSSTNNGVAAETDLTITTASGTSGAISYAANASAKDIADAITAAVPGSDLSVHFNGSVALSNLSAAGTVSFTLNGQSLSANIADTNDLSSLMSAINGVEELTGVSAEFTTVGRRHSITLKTQDGRNIGLGGFANNTAGNQSIKFGSQTLTEGGTVDAIYTGGFRLDSNTGPISLSNGNTDFLGTSTSTFASLSGVDLGTLNNADRAIWILDDAVERVSAMRARLGADQNRLGSAVSQIETFHTSLSAARSRILDSDYAGELATLARSQVLQRSATALFAQANQSASQVLSLLRRG